MDQVPNIDFNHGMGAAALGLLTFLVPLVIRTLMKDRREAQERAQKVLQECCRQAYNSVQNRIKRGDPIDDKAQAGIDALDRFYILRRGKPATDDEKEAARAIFDAIHGELCPGGTGTPPVNAP